MDSETFWNSTDGAQGMTDGVEFQTGTQHKQLILYSRRADGLLRLGCARVEGTGVQQPAKSSKSGKD